jgi:hypothetical protein
MRVRRSVVAAFALWAGACTERVPLPVAVDGDVLDGVQGDRRTWTVRDGAADSRRPPLDARADIGGVDALCTERTVDVDYSMDPDSQVIVAVERSASMIQGKLGEAGRLAAVQQALRSVIRAYQGSVSFGYEEFPAARTGCTACCAGEVKVFPGPGRYSLIDKEMRCESAPISTSCLVTNPDAPAFDSLARCADVYDALKFQYSRFVLLVTDGEPSCGASKDACQRTGLEAAKLLTDNVRTYVLGVSDESKGNTCLDAIAAAGGTQRTYVASDEAQLATRLQEILSPLAARACRVAVTGQISSPDRLSVYIENLPVRRDPADGWTFDFAGPGRVITLNGAACEKLKTTQVSEALRIYTTCTQCPGASCR